MTLPDQHFPEPDLKPTADTIMPTGAEELPAYAGPTPPPPLDSTHPDQDPYLDQFEATFFAATSEFSGGAALDQLKAFPFSSILLKAKGPKAILFNEDWYMYKAISSYLTRVTGTFWCARASILDPRFIVLHAPLLLVVVTDPLLMCRFSVSGFNANQELRLVASPSLSSFYARSKK